MTILISQVLSNSKGNLDLVKDSDSHRGRETNITPNTQKPCSTRGFIRPLGLSALSMGLQQLSSQNTLLSWWLWDHLSGRKKDNRDPPLLRCTLH